MLEGDKGVIFLHHLRLTPISKVRENKNHFKKHTKKLNAVYLLHQSLIVIYFLLKMYKDNKIFFYRLYSYE